MEESEKLKETTVVSDVADKETQSTCEHFICENILDLPKCDTSTTMLCSECKDAKEGSVVDVLLCLSCGHKGCGPFSGKSHALSHFKEQDSHYLALDVERCKIWCHVCEKNLPTEGHTQILKKFEAFREKFASDEGLLSVSCGKKKSLVGLQNVGYTCYMNSVLQCLFVLDRFREKLVHVASSKLSVLISPKNKSLGAIQVEVGSPFGPIFHTLSSLFMEMLSSQAKALYPSALSCAMRRSMPSFTENCMHDSHEYLLSLLDTISVEISKKVAQTIKNNFKKIQDDDFAEYTRGISYCFIEDLFKGEMSSEIRCNNCGNAIIVSEPFLDLSLPLDVEGKSLGFRFGKFRKNRNKNKRKGKRRGGNEEKNEAQGSRLAPSENTVRDKGKNNVLPVPERDNGCVVVLPIKELTSRLPGEGFKDNDGVVMMQNGDEVFVRNESLVRQQQQQQRALTPSPCVTKVERSNDDGIAQSLDRNYVKQLSDSKLSFGTRLKLFGKSLFRPFEAAMSNQNLGLKEVNWVGSGSKKVNSSLCHNPNSHSEPPILQIQRAKVQVKNVSSSSCDVLLNLNSEYASEGNAEMGVWTHAASSHTSPVYANNVCKREDDLFINPDTAARRLSPRLAFGGLLQSRNVYDHSRTMSLVDLREFQPLSPETLRPLTCVPAKLTPTSYQAYGEPSFVYKNKYENYPQNSVYGSLNKFFAPEDLDNGNKIVCNECTKVNGTKTYSEAVKRFNIVKLPKILVIHLKRFRDNGKKITKVSDHIKFPEKLDLLDYCLKKDTTPSSYSLCGVIEHIGDLHHGHYVAFVKDTVCGAESFSPWHIADDHSIRNTDIDTVLKANAYLLFYNLIPTSDNGS